MILIDFDSELPIYEQLKRQIIISIAKKEIKPGQRLPSVRQLAEEIGINLHTVSKAYNELKADGYLNIDRRVGAVVRDEFIDGNKDYKEISRMELEFIIADGFNRGIKKEEFLDFIEEMYDGFGGEEDEW